MVGRSSGQVQLVVGLLLDPATRAMPDDIFAYLVVDEDGQAEWQRSQPPRIPIIKYKML